MSGGRRVTLAEALGRVYLVRSNSDAGYLSFPKVLIGKRVKLVLVKDGDEV